MIYQFEFQPYQRPFLRPLHTHHGVWAVRQGVIVKLQDQNGQVGWGEIAPLPWFGSETWVAALDFCQRLSPTVSAADLFSVPNELPACQFGLGTAAAALGLSGPPSSLGAPQRTQRFPIRDSPLTYCGLLPTGAAALAAWPDLWHQGYHTLKWKIGLEAIDQELQLCQALLQALPTSAQLRLDANGGLEVSEAQRWLALGDHRSSGQIEYLEQPLPPAQFETMLSLSCHHRTPIALDESVATLSQMRTCYQRGWRGIFVVKAAIAGYPHHLRQFCQTHVLDLVFSSVFETEVGRQACLQLAQDCGAAERSLGFGIHHWFAPE